MSIKTFWTILLKILGIWLVIDSFVVIPQFFSALFLSMSYNTEMNVLITLGAERQNYFVGLNVRIHELQQFLKKNYLRCLDQLP